LNWQHCAHQTYFPSHSFEQWYQGVRRCWRFGQTRPVVVDVVTTDGAAGVLANMRRKAEQADRMFSELVANMNDALRLEAGAFGDSNTEVPGWLR
jgi:RecA/RadA recombinase